MEREEEGREKKTRGERTSEVGRNLQKLSSECTGERSRQEKRQVGHGGGGYSLALEVGLEVGTQDIGSAYRCSLDLKEHN